MNGFLSVQNSDDIIKAACTALRYRHVKAAQTCNTRPDWKMIWCDNTFEFRVERISKTEARKINLWTSEIKIIGPATIDIPQYIAYANKQGKRAFYGSVGAEVWYGGKTRVTHDLLDTVWSLIGELEGSYEFYPFTKTSKRRMVVAPDFSEAKALEILGMKLNAISL